MESFRFKTTINCASCVRIVKPVLDAQPQISFWEVDTQSNDKVLKIESEANPSEEIIKALEELGFEAELIA